MKNADLKGTFAFHKWGTTQNGEPVVGIGLVTFNGKKETSTLQQRSVNGALDNTPPSLGTPTPGTYAVSGNTLLVFDSNGDPLSQGVIVNRNEYHAMSVSGSTVVVVARRIKP